MYMHPYLAMTLANDRADRLRAAAATFRLVDLANERRHAERISVGVRPASPTKPGNPAIRVSRPLKAWDGS